MVKTSNFKVLIYNTQMNAEKLFTATIYLSLPQLGMALVREAIGGTPSYIPAILPTADTNFGAYNLGAFSAGTQVLCYRGYGGTNELCHIICAYNQSRTPEDNFYSWHTLNHMQDICMYDKHADYLATAYKAFKHRDDDLVIYDYSHRADADILPGDFDVIERETQTVGLHVGLYLAQLRASELAYIETSSLNNQVRIVGGTIKTDTPVHESVICNDYVIENHAVNVNEAFGFSTSPVAEPVNADEGEDDSSAKKEDSSTTADSDKDTLKLIEKKYNPVPLYRFQHIQGLAAHGDEATTVAFPSKTQTWIEEQGEEADVWHNKELDPPVLARQRQDLSGAITSASAKSILSAKTPYITAIQQLGYHCNPVKESASSTASDRPTDYTDLREEYIESNSTEQTERDTEYIDDVVINRVLKKLTANDYDFNLKAGLQTKGLSLSDPSKTALFDNKELKELQGFDTDGDPSCSGPTNAPTYPLPKQVQLTDPATGLVHTYYDSMSFISQEPDGSICICDGYGSEIRMSRGNIYISPALDLYVKAGRDVSVMAGRHQAYNSQDTCTIHSSQSAYIRAENDVKISGGTNKENTKASVMLENRSRLGGIDFKSNASVTMTASQDIYIGRHKQDAEDNESKLTEADSLGTILIDGGDGGTCYMKAGQTCTLDANTITLCSIVKQAYDEYKGSVFELTPGYLAACMPAIQLTGTLFLRKTAETDESVIKIIRNGQVRDASIICAGSDNPNHCYIGGTLIVQQDLEVNGMGLFKGVDRSYGLAANGVISQVKGSATRHCLVAPYDDNLQPDELKAFKKRVDVEDYVISPSANSFSANLVEAAVARTFNDKRLNEIEFAYPDYRVYVTTIPGMMWQVRSRLYHNEDSELKFWLEPELQALQDKEKVTMCYPGLDIWRHALVSDRQGITHILNESGYPINAQ